MYLNQIDDVCMVRANSIFSQGNFDDNFTTKRVRKTCAHKILWCLVPLKKGKMWAFHFAKIFVEQQSRFGAKKKLHEIKFQISFSLHTHNYMDFSFVRFFMLFPLLQLAKSRRKWNIKLFNMYRVSMCVFLDS